MKTTRRETNAGHGLFASDATIRKARKFKITEIVGGADRGTYEGLTWSDALDAMARAAGFEDIASAREASAIDPSALMVAELFS